MIVVGLVYFQRKCCKTKLNREIDSWTSSTQDTHTKQTTLSPFLHLKAMFLLSAATAAVPLRMRGLALCAGASRPRVAVVLSGCGVYDGSEIHEASAALVALSRLG